MRLANIHSFTYDGGDLLVDDQISDGLTLPNRGSPPERVFTLLFNALVWFDKVA